MHIQEQRAEEIDFGPRAVYNICVRVSDRCITVYNNSECMYRWVQVIQIFSMSLFLIVDFGWYPRDCAPGSKVFRGWTGRII